MGTIFFLSGVSTISTKHTGCE